MTYRLGVDLGTTYTSAAVASGGKARIVALGNRSAVMPSVVYARPDGELLVGERADRRGMAEPQRVAREFKRRMGDPNAIDLGGTRLTADRLMAALLPSILETATEKEGGPPDRLALTHPANWGQAKRTLLRESVNALGLDLPPLQLVTEPEAAAIYYAETERIDVGEVVAVYDLGGGTFDAAVLRKTDTGFTLVGPPEGIDRLGGVDFDAAVFAHINRFLDGALDQVDANDPAVASGLSRLRADCVEAKEALSADTDVNIPVLLPGIRTELRMTRNEFESMIRPALGDTIGALKRALRAAHVVPSDVKVVLLVGGSSRIPLVAQTVGAEIGRPVAIDVHPKHAVALGAALAADVAHRGPQPATEPTAPAAAAAVVAAPAAPIPATPTPDAAPPASPAAGPAVGAPTLIGAAPSPSPATSSAPSTAAPGPPSRPGPASTPPPSGPAPTGPAGPGSGPEPASGGRGDGAGGKRLGLVVALVALVVAVVGAVVVLGGGGDDGTEAASPSSAAPDTGSTSPTATSSAVASSTIASTSSSTTATSAAPSSTTASTVSTATTLPADCVGAGEPFVCITSVSADAAGNLIIPFKVSGFIANKGTGRHIHFFFPNNPKIQADILNAGASGPDQAEWVLWDLPNPFGQDGLNGPYTVADAKSRGATEICVLVADNFHAVTPGTGNCLPIPPELLA